MVNFLDEVPLCLGSNTPGFPKQLSNSAAGTKQANPCSLQGWIARQKIEQGSGTWGAPSRTLVKTDASPRCRFRRADPSGSKAHDGLANESIRVLDPGDRLLAVACAIF